MDGYLVLGVEGDDQGVLAGVEVEFGEGDGLGQARGGFDVDEHLLARVEVGVALGGGEFAGGVVDADFEEVAVADGEGDVADVLAGGDGDEGSLVILPQTGIDVGIVPGPLAQGQGFGAQEVAGGAEVQELKSAVGPGDGALLEAVGGDGDEGVDGGPGLVADGTGEGAWGGRPHGSGLGEKDESGEGKSDDSELYGHSVTLLRLGEMLFDGIFVLLADLWVPEKPF